MNLIERSPSEVRHYSAGAAAALAFADEHSVERALEVFVLAKHVGEKSSAPGHAAEVKDPRTFVASLLTVPLWRVSWDYGEGGADLISLGLRGAAGGLEAVQGVRGRGASADGGGEVEWETAVEAGDHALLIAGWTYGEAAEMAIAVTPGLTLEHITGIVREDEVLVLTPARSFSLTGRSGGEEE